MNRTPLLRIFALWRPYAFVLGAGAVVSVAALAAALALSVSASRVLAALLLGVALVGPTWLGTLGIARVVLRYAERLISHDAMFRALTGVRLWFFRGVARGAAGGLGYRRSADMLSRLVADVDALDGLYLRIIVPALCALLALPVLAVFAWRAGPFAAVIAAIPVLFGAIVVPLRAMRAASDAGPGTAEALAALRVAVVDGLGAMKEVKVFGAEGRVLSAVQAREATYLGAQRAFAAHIARLNQTGFVCLQAALLALLVLGDGKPAPTLVAAFLLVTASEVLGALPRIGVLFGQSEAAAARVVEVAETPEVTLDPPTPAALPNATALVFEHVRFRWSEAAPLVLEDLTLQIPAGSRVGIVGPSGGGKSTIAALALRLAAPEAGQIRLGGVDIATLGAAALRSRIAYLSQSTHLFADTVRANLRLAAPDADDATLWAALEAAQIADVVHGLEEGLGGFVGEAGNTLSGGQGRRLVLARTLLSPAPIVILDEPCAGLDADTEIAFLQTLNTVLAGRSLLLIAHRLTGVERLDRVWRLSQGRLMAATG